MQFKVGDLVGIPCVIGPGPFSNERAITIKTNEGELSGFVNLGNLRMLDDKNGIVKATITQITPTGVVVQISASLFTSAAGQATLSRDWASSNLTASAAA